MSLPIAAQTALGGEPILALNAGGHTAVVTKALFTPNGQQLISVSLDKTIRLWDVRTGELLEVLRPPIGPGMEGAIYAAAMSPDGRTLAVAGYGAPDADFGNIHVITLSERRIERVLLGHTDAVFALAFSPDGRRLASGSSDKTARLWNTETWASERVLRGHTSDVLSIAFAPDSRRLATASKDLTGTIWSAETGKAEVALKGHEKEVFSIAWSPDGRTLATGSFDHFIHLWDTQGRIKRRFDMKPATMSSLAFTANSKELLVTRGQGGPDVCSILDIATVRERIRFTRHANTVLSGCLSPDGALAATAGGDNGEVYLWRTYDGALVHKLAGEGRGVVGAGWSADGQSIFWGCTSKFASDNNRGPIEWTFRLADLESAERPAGTCQRAIAAMGVVSLEKTDQTSVTVSRSGQAAAVLRLSEQYDEVRCFTMLQGDRAAVGGSFGLTLFDTRTGKNLRALEGHTGHVWAVAPSPDGRYVLSASSDNTLRIWDPARHEPLVSLFFAGGEWIAWTPHGYYACSSGGERLMGWHLNNGPGQLADFHPAAQFRKSLYRPDIIKLMLEAGSVELAMEIADHQRGKKSEPAKVAEVLPPEAAIASPATGIIVAQQDIEVQATAASVGDHPVTAMRLLVDGRPYLGQAGIKRVAVPASGAVKEQWTVQLTPGTHRFKVLADSAVSQGASQEVEVTYLTADAPREVELPNLYVLAVGISAYSGDLSLNYAAKDAQDISRTLQDKSKTLFRKVEVTVLTDQQATRQDILKGFSWLRKQMTQRDVGVVFFSGHGEKDSDGTLYFLPVDVNAEDLLSSGVPADQLAKTLSGLPGRVVAVLDACHSGGLDPNKRRAAGSLTDDLVRDLVAEENGLVVMCSSTGREFSLENNMFSQGNFTLALVEGLSGKADYNKDGTIYLTELDNYATDRVKELTNGRQHPVTAKPTSIRSFPLARPEGLPGESQPPGG